MAAPVDHPLSWNKTTTSAFIDVLKLHVCLWNIKSESYKNRDLRRAAYFRSIIDEFEKSGVPIKETDIKTKINTLRNQFRKEHRKFHHRAHHQSSDSVNASTGDQGGK